MNSESASGEWPDHVFPEPTRAGQTAYPEVNQKRLADHALEIVTQDLAKFGNVVSEWHRASLLELLDILASYCVGTEKGRQSFGVPTGMGKTSAITAFVTALHRLGYQVPVAIAASRIHALVDLKRKLEAHGVPPEWIGLKHSKWDADEESTDSAPRLVQLVTHARVRAGLDYNLYGEYQGRPRPLMIWDESLLRSKAKAIPHSLLRQAYSSLSIDLEGRTDSVSVGVLNYVQEVVRAISKKIEELEASGDPDSTGLALRLPGLSASVFDAYTAAIERLSRTLKHHATCLQDLLEAAQGPMQVIKVEQGAGVVAIAEAIPAALKDVVILDASTSVRKLVHADRSVLPVSSFRPEDQKDFSKVRVHQILSGGGRSTIEKYFQEPGNSGSAVSKEIIGIVKAMADARSFLLFTFKPQGIDTADHLARDMSRAGIDLKAKTADGKPRFEFLTWGNHEGINGFEHCDVVIMVGVVQRGSLDLAATLKAQLRNLAAPTPPKRLRDLRESEVAHAIYQGASRGSCRRVTNGQAGAMDLFIIHRSRDLASLMAPVMPNADWQYREPEHIRKANDDSKTQAVFDQVVVYLQGLPRDVEKVSTTIAKKDMGLTDSTKAQTMLFTRACGHLCAIEHGWTHEGRSFVRQSHFDSRQTD